MRVLILSDGEDNGGVGGALKIAFDKYTDWEVRAVRRRNNFINFPGDITVNDWSEILPLYEKADVVHMMDKFSTIEWAPGWEKKPRLMHHHGLVFGPTSAVKYSQRCRDEGIPQITALPGLTQYAPEIVWLPNPCDINMMQGIRRANWRPYPKVRISQTPAQRAPNATDVFLRAFEGVKDRAELALIERVDWISCLTAKAKSDVSFDSFISGYGLAGMEAMAMGIPLISGALDTYTETFIAGMRGELPYLSATPTTLAAQIAAMVDSPSLRAEYARVGLDFAATVHDERQVVAQLKAIYIQTKEGGASA